MLDFKKAVQSVFKEDNLFSKMCLEFAFKNVNSIIDGTLKDEDLGFEKFLEYARSLMGDKTE